MTTPSEPLWGFRYLKTDPESLDELATRLPDGTMRNGSSEDRAYLRACADRIRSAIPFIESSLASRGEEPTICKTCSGSGYLNCDDPQCDDSTWDHNCTAGAKCPGCNGKKIVPASSSREAPAAPLDEIRWLIVSGTVGLITHRYYTGDERSERGMKSRRWSEDVNDARRYESPQRAESVAKRIPQSKGMKVRIEEHIWTDAGRLALPPGAHQEPNEVCECGRIKATNADKCRLCSGYVAGDRDA